MTAEVSSTETDEVQYEENVAKLKEEIQKTQPSQKTIRNLMNSTFEGVRHSCYYYIFLYCVGRQKWVLEKAPTVTTIIDFSPLTNM